MHKKLAATLTIALFVISTFAIMMPASAHFTLGRLTPNYRYHEVDFDPHTPGLIGYVWPGGGMNSYTGAPGTVPLGSWPGYQTPWPGANPPGAGVSSFTWNQLEGHAYAPFGAILASTSDHANRGDLIFAINQTTLNAFNGAWYQWVIAIPPEFGDIKAEQVVSTLSNNYAGIFVRTVPYYDRTVPGWTIIVVNSDGWTDSTGKLRVMNFTTTGHEWYYVRVNGVTAPEIAGKYFFKMWLGGSRDAVWIPNPWTSGWGFSADTFVNATNWPVLLVKGEIDPAIMYGTIRYGGYNTTLYGQPVQEAGKVWARMQTKLDPYTGQARPDLCDNYQGIACTDARGYFNASARGHYEVEGVAPGVYDLIASIAGYPQQTIATGVTVLAGQSLLYDGYLNPGVVIHGDVYTKHQFGEQPWPIHYDSGAPYRGVRNNYIKIELYDAPTKTHQPDSAANLVSWSPLPCIAGGNAWYGTADAATPGRYRGGRDATACGNPNGNTVAFPWHEYTGLAGQDMSPLPNPGYLVASGIDPQGVGPNQAWVVAAGTTTPFHFEFGQKGMYGAPRDLDGQVPQLYATWINGLTPGRYYVRAWVYRYVQSEIDGATFHEYFFDVAAQEWAGDISVPIDLRISSWINKTVHFHNTAGTIMTDSINTGAGFLYGALKSDAGGGLNDRRSYWAWNLTQLTANMFRSGTSYVTLYGWGVTWIGRNYGIPAGTYTPTVWALGYVQQVFDKVSVTLSGTPTYISNHLYRGAGFNITVYSIDWERPRVDRYWVWPGAEIDIAVLDSNKELLNIISEDLATGPLGTSCVGDAPILGAPGSTCWTDFNDDLPTSKGHPHGLVQIANATHFEVDGGGRNIEGLGGLVRYDRSAYGVYFGDEAAFRFVGGRYRDRGPFSVITAPRNILGPIVYTPTAFESGQYYFRGYTYGYVAKKDFSVYAQKGQVADIKVNIMIGVNITLDILFKKEKIITPTANNMSSRIRVFNENGKLVGEWMSSEGVYTINSSPGLGSIARGAETPGYFFAGGDQGSGADTAGGGLAAPGVFAAPGGINPYRIGGYANPLEYTNYIPGGTRNLRVTIAGVPALLPSRVLPLQPATPYKFGDPVFAPEGFGIDAVDLTYYPSYGIDGYPNYQGTWTVEVDFVNWYNNFTVGAVSQYYPPPAGLLLGESFHTISATHPSGNLFGWTEVGALSADFVEHSMAPNHLGPYAQEGVWSLTNAHLSGETSAIFEVDLRGLLIGNVLAFTWSTEFRPLSWATVSILGADNQTYLSYTSDGMYEFYSAPGTYKLTVTEWSPAGEGHKVLSASVALTTGQTAAPGTGQNLYMEQSNIPIPEFNGLAIVTLSALAASLYLLRRRRQ